MDFQEFLQEFSNACTAQEIECILVGAWAMNAYGVARQTVDIDFACEKRHLHHLDDIFNNHGYTRVYKTELFAKYRSKDEGLLDIDMLFLSRETLHALQSDTRTVRIGAIDFTVPSLENLIAMKLHALKHNAARRFTKDMADIVALVDTNDIPVHCDSFHKLCLKFGTEDLYKQLLHETGGESA